MAKWTVAGSVEVTVSIIVEAETEDEAMELAEEKFGGVKSYCGNGGYDKLIGVDGDSESIACDGEVEFDDCYEGD